MVIAVKNQRVRKPRKNLKRNLFIASLLVVPLLHFLVFWLYINIETISLAFMDWDIYTNSYKFVGFDNFVTHFESIKAMPEHLNLYINSLRAIPINICCLILAIVIGYAFSKHIRGERVFRVIFYMPSMISLVILTLCYRYMFEYKEGMLQGPAAELLRFLGFNYNGWNDPNAISTSWWLVSIFCVWASAGINIILVSSAMSRIPESVIESAKLDGVGFWRELFQIRIPLIMPTISVFLVNSMMAVSAFFMQPMLLTDNPSYDFKTVGWFVFDNATASNAQKPGVSTIGFILTVVVSLLVIVVKKITDKLTPDVDF